MRYARVITTLRVSPTHQSPSVNRYLGRHATLLCTNLVGEGALRDDNAPMATCYIFPKHLDGFTGINVATSKINENIVLFP